ncbi:MAG: hypothetical protein CSA04_05965 [Bacteroidetes bacterium]|nr:MAG: hypothetical protein CSA04_05965 [Bacteroidota bacterium]
MMLRSYGQGSWLDKLPDNYYVESRVGYGFLIPHHLETRELQTHFVSHEVALGYLSYGKSRWEYLYEYPRVGLSLWFSTFGRSEYIGKAYGLHPHICFPWYGDPTSRLSFRLGVGVGYLTKPYDPVSNYKNIAIGSYVNAAINLKLEYQHAFSERFVFNGSLDFQHFSNGSLKTPNHGLNGVSCSVGMMYHLRKPNRFDRRKVLPELYMFEFDGKRFAYLAMTSYMGVKDQSYKQGDRLMAVGLSLEMMKPLNFKHKLGVGLDVIHYVPLSHEIRSQQLTKYGLCGAWHVWLWEVSMDMALGLELLNRGSVFLGAIYEKAAIKYHFDNGLYPYFGIKAVYGRADFIMFGVGYNLKVIYY